MKSRTPESRVSVYRKLTGIREPGRKVISQEPSGVPRVRGMSVGGDETLQFFTPVLDEDQLVGFNPSSRRTHRSFSFDDPLMGQEGYERQGRTGERRWRTG